MQDGSDWAPERASKSQLEYESILLTDLFEKALPWVLGFAAIWLLWSTVFGAIRVLRANDERRLRNATQKPVKRSRSR